VTLTADRRVNIKDVARRAGVSPTTVSHALGGQRPVSAATRRRVREAAAELGYRPHPGARSLKAGSTGVIALCAVNASGASGGTRLEYFSRLMRGVTEAAREHEYASVVVPDGHEGAHWDRLLLDGAVISDPTSRDPNLRFLREQALPYVTIGRDPDRPHEGYWVADDAEAGARLVLDHLRERGARDIAVVTFPTPDDRTQVVLRTYGDWCIEHGCRPRVEEVEDDTDVALSRAASRVLEGPQRPDAVFGLSEPPAAAVLRHAAEIGLDVPGELMVAGPSAFGQAEASAPAMTTLEFDAERHAREATDMLIRLVRGQTVDDPRRVLPVRLVERESTRR
jgi:DNA-binding LacI/PurR family transcriptional regulator